MSWLQRNIFARKRSASQTTDAEQQQTANGESSTSVHSQAQRLAETEQQLRQRYQQQSQDTDSIISEDTEEVDLPLLPDEEDIDSADGLFAKLSITEMRRYEQSLQKRIETMRAQMRRVAGKHYPELIDAADSAVAMDAASAKISVRLNSLRVMLESTQQQTRKRQPIATAHSASEQDSGGGARAKVYAIAAQVKVLVDTPEQIWKALGAQRFLQAALLYMIACEIHGRLHRQSRLLVAAGGGGAHEDGATAVDPLLAFPVIERQWESVTPFREQISAKARQLLASHSGSSASAEAGLSAICAIALLEDVDAEMACTIFLAHRGESLNPLLDRLLRMPAAADVGAGELVDGMLQELLGGVRQILTDYVAVFGIPPSDELFSAAEEKRQYASKILTTLASICADCDLPMPPPSMPPSMQQRAMRPATGEQQTPSLAKRRSELQQGLRARGGRRTASIAGSVLSSSAPIVSDTPSTPWTSSERGGAGGAVYGGGGGGGGRGRSAFIVGKYLPREIAQFRPPLARMLDGGGVGASGEEEEEAEEEGQAGALESCLGDPAALLRALASEAQPRLERIASHALRLWWAGFIAGVQDAAQSAIGAGVVAVADAARIGAALRRWEEAGDDTWPAVASNPVLASLDLSCISQTLPPCIGQTPPLPCIVGQTPPSPPLPCAAGLASLYAAVVEPLLQRRARQLHFAAVDRALAQPEAFLAGDSDDDVAAVLAGHLPWRGGPLACGSLADAVGDARRSLDFVPPAVRALGDAVAGALLAAWRDGAGWWRLMRGAAAAQAEADACARHFAEQWAAMAQRLGGQWAADAVAVAQAQAMSDNKDSGAGENLPPPPAPVMRCVKGAWVAAVLVDVATRTDSALAQALPLPLPLTLTGAELQSARRRLLVPWFAHLGCSLGAAWAAQFKALYFVIPRALRAADAAATRRDVVRAWTASRASDPALLPLSARYSALRRVCVQPTAAPGGEAAAMLAGASPAVRCLALGLRAQVQAVCGLAPLFVDHSEMRRVVGRAAAEALLAHVLPGDFLEAGEWDAVQLAADIRFVCEGVGGDDTGAFAPLISAVASRNIHHNH